MPGNYTHSRAAILCFGGWGLQTLLHLAPRIQAAQEQRAAQGVATPDLNRITSFGVVLPEPLLTGSDQVQFTLRRLRSAQSLPPFYVERVLAEIERNMPTPAETMAGAVLTHAERRAVALARATESVLQPLQFEGRPFRSPAAGASISLRHPDAETGKNLRRATRQDFMQAGVQHADPVSRLLEAHLIDPIRQDSLSPDDLFVQTTLYVVAPLFEPLASALIWPVVAGLMSRVGRRHISNVVAFFAAGSYATDRTRALEDAAAHAALSELELLTGLRKDAQAQAALGLRIGKGGPALLDQIGEPIFDQIYLLDREKSNQGLAEDSHELAVLTGNALEAFVAGSADLYVQEQLGYSLRADGRRPYSLIGSAADYVPVQQILHAVNRTEESRLVREWVLRNTPDEIPEPSGRSHPLANTRERESSGRGRSGQGNPSLKDLGFSEPRALSLLAARMPQLFAGPNNALDAERVADLSVRESFVFSPVAAAELRAASPLGAPAEWMQAFDAHLQGVRHTFDLAAGADAVDEAWGLTTAGAEAAPRGLPAFAAGLEADDRMAPQLLTRMHKRLLDLLAASPTGLIRAHEQSRQWLHEAEESMQRLEISLTPSVRELGRIQRDQALHEWQVKYAEAVAKAPSLGAIMLRAVAAIVVVSLIALGYLWLIHSAWNPVRDGLTLAGFAVGILAAGLATNRLHQTRVANLRRARVDLARAELTALLQAQAHDGLVRSHTRLIQVLQDWQQMLREAMDELRELSTPPEMPAVPPAGILQTYLYVPYFNQMLWDRCLAYLRTHLDAHGQRSEERLDNLWGQAEWRRQMERILRTVPRAPVLGSDAAQHSRAQMAPGAIAEFIRQTVHQSVAPISIQDPSPVRAELLHALAGEFSIEQLLWRSAADAQDINRRLRAMGILDAPAETEPAPWTDRRYVESAWNRAKPAANYDVADRLAVYGVTVDFAAAAGQEQLGPSGLSSSQLSRALLQEFNISLLPTENPFTILFVRTVHGLALDDLDSMRRYRQEMRYLPAEQRALICLDVGREDTLYQPSGKQTPVIQPLPAPTS